MNLTKPRRLIDRKYKRLVMANETCVVAQRLREILREREYVAWTGTAEDIWICAPLGDRQYEFHHVKKDGGGKTGSKDDDRRGIKVCAKHHEMAGRRDKFEADFGIDLEAVIVELNAKYPKEELKREPQKRQATAKVGLGIKGCPECGGGHFYPLNKVEFGVKLIGYRCKVKNQWVELKTA